MTRASKLQIAQAIAVVLLLSFIIGGQARATKARTNTARLRALETQVTALTDELEGASERIVTLENLTQLLDQDGTYYGYVNGAQVWSHHCESGTGASWEAAEGFVELSCPSNPSARRLTRMERGEGVKAGSPFRDRR